MKVILHLEGGGSVFNRKVYVNLHEARIQISSYYRFYLKIYVMVIFWK